MSRIQHIRQKEKEYHEHCYSNYKLFEEGSWLYKPVSGVIEMMNVFQDQQSVTALDLGCGVGRNSIPIAQRMKAGKVDIYSFILLLIIISRLAVCSTRWSATILTYILLKIPRV